MKRLKSFFEIYLWRKIVLLSNFVFGLLGIVFMEVQIQEFFVFKKAEIDFLPNAPSSLNDLEKIFLTSIIFVMVFFLMIVIISCCNFCYLFKEIKNLVVLFRIITWLFIFSLVLSFLIIALQPNDVIKTVKINDFRTQVKLDRPTYV